MNQPSPNAQRLLGLFEELRRHRPEGVHKRLSQLNLSFSHVRALHLLERHGPLAMKDLATQLQLTPPSVTALARRLSQTGMLRRETHPEDSRLAMLSLTEQGRDLLKQLYQHQIERTEQLLQGLSAAEQEQFLSLLERAIAALRSSE